MSNYIGNEEVTKLVLNAETNVEVDAVFGPPVKYGQEPNAGDKICVFNFDSGSTTYKNLETISTSSDIITSPVKFGTKAMHCYTPSSGTSTQLKVRIPENYLGRDWTLEFWWRPYNSTSYSGNIFSLEDQTVKGPKIVVSASSSSLKSSLNVHGNSFGSGGALTMSDWNHIAITHDADSGVNLYVNGALAASANVTHVTRNDRVYNLWFFAYLGYNDAFDAINFEYGLKYTGDSYTVPTSAPSEEPSFTPSGYYSDNIPEKKITYNSTIPATLNGVVLPTTLTTTEVTLLDQLTGTPEYAGSDTSHRYVFDSWKVNGSDITDFTPVTNGMTLDAEWNILPPGTGFFLVGDCTSGDRLSEYEFQWDGSSAYYTLQNVYVYGRWRIESDSVRWGPTSMNYELQSHTNYTMRRNSSYYFYNSGEYMYQINFYFNNGRIWADFF